MMVDLPSYGPTCRIRFGSFLRSRPLLLNYTGDKTLSEFQVKCVLTSHDIPFEKLRADKQDLLFVDNNNEPIPYWIEKADSIEIIVWLKFSEIIPGREIFWLYYGSGNFSGASDVDATFIRVIDGLVASWHFDEGSGTTAYDSSGNNNDGTIYGATWINGKFGKALNFDGTDDYVSDGSNINVDDLSVEALVNVEEFEEWDVIVQRANDDGRGFALRLGPYSGFAFQAKQYSAVANKVKYFCSTNEWYHLVGTYSSESGLSLFINGEEATTDYNSEAEDGGGTILEIGRRANAAQNYFKGIIDEVRIYDRALTPEEVLDLYNNYGYTTTNYPGKVLVRKYTEPEPSVSLGAEENL